MKAISLIKSRSAWFIFAFDILCAELGWLISGLLISERPDFLLERTGFVLVAFAVSLKFFRTYAAFWKATTLIDLKRNIYAVFTGAALFFALEFMFTRLLYVSRASIVFFPLLTFVLMMFGRLLYRQLRANRDQRRATKRLLLIGAGAGAELFLRENENLAEPYRVVAILDDDAQKHGKLLMSRRIVGDTHLLENKNFLNKYPFDEALIAVPSIESERLSALYRLCHSFGKPVNVLPRVLQVAQGMKLTQLKEVDIEDLLGRDPVQIEFAALEKVYDGASVLVTGGAGSIGSEICRQLLLNTNIETLVVLDHSEFQLYEIEQQILKIKPKANVIFKLVNILDRERVGRIINDYQINILFHAAAYKHVPLLEDQPEIAIHNNILGTIGLVDVAVECELERFIMISTDKAVNPTNVMGATKRVAELYVQAERECKTKFMVTRFGNVLGSNGSVVPLFKAQLKAGGPITVTHPEIERYFMTIDEAACLVLLSGAVGKGGETFVLDMGKPVKIRELAEQLIRLSGQHPGVDIKIEYTGLRPGEKLYEELFYSKEKLESSGYKKLKRGRSVKLKKSVLSAAIKTLNEVNSKDSLLALVKAYG